MGIWTTKNGKRYKLNIGTASIVNLQNDGARFCRIRDNPGIRDENNDTYYEAANGDGGESYRGLRESITVKCEDGDIITGYIIHLVDGFECHGTDEGDWFIIKPESKQELIVEDL
tara:strand:+ start:55 stop:399 length:345 start_codon:yes stop_codon:yes gene_type:complete